MVDMLATTENQISKWKSIQAKRAPLGVQSDGGLPSCTAVALIINLRMRVHDKPLTATTEVTEVLL